MLNRHVYLSMGLVLLVDIAGGPSRAEEADTRQSKQCGGYYACIEHRPQPLIWREKPSLPNSNTSWRWPSRGGSDLGDPQ
jgi:hypothetical protein